MELALSSEKLTNEKLLNLHSVASKNGDVHLADLLDRNFLGEQFAAWNYAMELALSLEKLTNEKLLNLHSVASKNGDVHLADLLDRKFLGEQFAAWNYGVVIIWFDVLQFSCSGFSCKEKDLNLNVALRLSSISKIYKHEGDSGGVKVDKIEMRIFIKQLTGKQLQPKNS
ncbi:hypothetical protein RIF29_25127 [Crotalaria pallida]|uniref:Ferritin n=1 Tax=Crotalaria pallida TaxID=3830 RepID=A0AAN9ET81_CROPI